MEYYSYALYILWCFESFILDKFEDNMACLIIFLFFIGLHFPQLKFLKKISHKAEKSQKYVEELA